MVVHGACFEKIARGGSVVCEARVRRRFHRHLSPQTDRLPRQICDVAVRTMEAATVLNAFLPLGAPCLRCEDHPPVIR